MSLDNDVYLTINSRYVRNQPPLPFAEAEENYLKFFLSLTNEQLESYLIVLPIGSIIMHGSTAPNYINLSRLDRCVPPVFPVINKDKDYTAIKKVLNEESKMKAINTINHDADEPDKEGKINEYLMQVRDFEKEGFFYGKPYLWCNTTMDANIMVDVRLMRSMNVYITNRDVILLDYFKLSQEMLKVIDQKPVFFKRSIDLGKEVIYSKDINAGMYSSVIDVDTANQTLMMRIRNKLGNSMGDAVLIELVNYLLSLKGFPFRIDGYTDYDVADSTPSLYDKQSSYICDQEPTVSGDGEYTCREIMLSNAKDCLSYLGSQIIEGLTEDRRVSHSELAEIKKNTMDTIFHKLQKLVIKRDNHYATIRWCLDQADYLSRDGSNLFSYFRTFYQRMRLLPHYRFDFESMDDRKLIYLIGQNFNKPAFNSIGLIPVVYRLNIDLENLSMLGGSEEKIESLILQAITQKHKPEYIYPSEIFQLIKDYLDSKMEVAGKTKDQLYYEYRKSVNDSLTKSIHLTSIHQECLDIIRRVEEKVYDDPTTWKKIREELGISVMSALGIETMENVVIVYLKGSSALHLNVVKYIKLTQKCQLEEEFKRLHLNLSDFDLNVILNPVIKKYDRKNGTSYYDKLVHYFTQLFYHILDNERKYLDSLYDLEFYRQILRDTNLHWYQTLHSEPSFITVIANLLDERYVHLHIDQNHSVINLEKIPIDDSIYSPFKVSVNKSIDNFVLIRLVFSAKTNKFVKCIGELIDISIIKDDEEASSLWYEDTIRQYLGIHINNYLGIYFDLNITLMNNTRDRNFDKYDKRVKRMALLEKMICCMDDDNEIKIIKESLGKLRYYDGSEMSYDKLCHVLSCSLSLTECQPLFGIPFLIEDESVLPKTILGQFRERYHQAMELVRDDKALTDQLSADLSYQVILPQLCSSIHTHFCSQKDVINQFYRQIYQDLLTLWSDLIIILSKTEGRTLLESFMNFDIYKKTENFYGLAYYRNRDLIVANDISSFENLVAFFLNQFLQDQLSDINQASYEIYPYLIKSLNSQLKAQGLSEIATENITFSPTNLLHQMRGEEILYHPLEVRIRYPGNQSLANYPFIISILSNPKVINELIEPNIIKILSKYQITNIQSQWYVDKNDDNQSIRQITMALLGNRQRLPSLTLLTLKLEMELGEKLTYQLGEDKQLDITYSDRYTGQSYIIHRYRQRLSLHIPHSSTKGGYYQKVSPTMPLPSPIVKPPKTTSLPGKAAEVYTDPIMNQILSSLCDVVKKEIDNYISRYTPISVISKVLGKKVINQLYWFTWTINGLGDGCHTWQYSPPTKRMNDLTSPTLAVIGRSELDSVAILYQVMETLSLSPSLSLDFDLEDYLLRKKYQWI